MTTDSNGSTLTEGARITGWRDGIPYTGTVNRILPQNPGCEGHRHLAVTRDDGSEIETFSDAVVVTGAARAQDDPEVARIVRNMDLLAGGPETDPFT